MSIVPQFLHMSVVGVRVRDEESSLDRAAVRVRPPSREYVLCVNVPVLVVDGPGECEGYHLRSLRNFIVFHSSNENRSYAIRGDFKEAKINGYDYLTRHEVPRY